MELIYNDGKMPPWRGEKIFTKTTFGYVLFVHVINVICWSRFQQMELHTFLSVLIIKDNTQRWTHCLMWTPDEAGINPLTLDLPPTYPPKFKAHRLRTPTQGSPRTLCLRKTTNPVRTHQRCHWCLQEGGYSVLYPKRYLKVEISGKKRLSKEPLLPGLVFAYMPRERTHDFVKQPSKTAKFLKYYTDKTKPIEPGTQLNPPITIPDGRMK